MTGQVWRKAQQREAPSEKHHRDNAIMTASGEKRVALVNIRNMPIC